MSKKEVVEALVEGGKATPAPPLGPALGQLKVNIKAIIDDINSRTKDFAGMKVPVKITVDVDTKEYTIEVGTPPTSQLIKKELGLEKLSQTPGKQEAGNLTMEQVIKIARMKKDSMLVNGLMQAIKNVLGSCVSAGVSIEGKSALDVIKELDEGKYDSLIKE